MAPKRRLAKAKIKASISKFPPPKSSYLDKLPTELVERICDFLPRRDTILQIRSTCRELAAKTDDKFFKAYWSNPIWTLSSRGWRDFIIFTAEHCAFRSHITKLELSASATGHDYDDYVLAKGWGPGTELGAGCSKLRNLCSLNLTNFDFKKSRKYLRSVCRKIFLPKLTNLCVTHMIVEDLDLSTLLANHRKTLCHVVMNNVDVYGGWNDDVEWVMREAGPGASASVADLERTPWTPVFESLLKFENDSFVQIEWPGHLGRLVEFLMDDGFLFDDDLENSPRDKFWGATIDYVADFDSDDSLNDLNEWHEIIQISKTPNWKKAVRRLISMYEYWIRDPEGDGTPTWGCGSDYELPVSEFNLAETKKKSAAPELADLPPEQGEF